MNRYEVRWTEIIRRKRRQIVFASNGDDAIDIAKVENDRFSDYEDNFYDAMDWRAERVED